MEFMDVLSNRRAVRDFTSDQLDRFAIERPIGAAILAPSAMNLQPWAFAALLDAQRIDSYAERAQRWLLENETSFGEAGREILERSGFSLFDHAPALVLVMAQSRATQAVEDCCLAAQNLMPSARSTSLFARI